jgi:hypothetical protein
MHGWMAWLKHSSSACSIENWSSTSKGLASFYNWLPIESLISFSFYINRCEGVIEGTWQGEGGLDKEHHAPLARPTAWMVQGVAKRCALFG